MAAYDPSPNAVLIKQFRTGSNNYYENYEISGSSVLMHTDITGSVTGSNFTLAADTGSSYSVVVYQNNAFKLAASISGTSGVSGGGGGGGTSGVSGAQGAQGASGTSGVAGTSGVKGSTGAQGAQGASGAGTSGVSGTSGVAGTSGVQGAAGTSGVTGTSGVQGAAGTSGVAEHLVLKEQLVLKCSRASGSGTSV